MRQLDIFNPENQRLRITIIGAGSVGSFLTLNLAKLGFNNLEVYDFDKVEEHNIPNQFYRVQDVGKKKVDALKEIVNSFTGIEIEGHTTRAKLIEPEGDQLIVFTVDSLSERKKLAKGLKDYPSTLLDIRVGGEGYSIFAVDLTDSEQYRDYMDSLEGKDAELPCGAKSIIYTILAVTSEAARMVKMIDKEEKVPRIIKRELSKYMFLVNQPDAPQQSIQTNPPPEPDEDDGNYHCIDCGNRIGQDAWTDDRRCDNCHEDFEAANEERSSEP